MSEQVFGRMFVPRDLEEAMLDTLRRWQATYLAEIERQRELTPESLPLVSSFSTSNEFYKWNEDAIPAAIAVSPGRVPGRRERRSDGSYAVWYRCAIAVIVGAADRDQVRMLGGFYGAAIRAAILQHQDLGLDGTISEQIEWSDERFTDVPDDAQRTLGSVQEFFEVLVPDVVNWRLGLLEPAPDPYEDPTEPDIVSATTDIEPMEATP